MRTYDNTPIQIETCRGTSKLSSSHDPTAHSFLRFSSETDILIFHLRTWRNIIPNLSNWRNI